MELSASQTHIFAMIQPNELRIGNWVWCGYNCTIGQIEGMMPEDLQDGRYSIKVSTAKLLVDLACLDPIDLTTGRLVKCGFELFPWGYVKKSSNDFTVRLTIKQLCYEVSGNNPVRLQYLHQLQNLYFALTMEEIEIHQSALQS